MLVKIRVASSSVFVVADLASNYGIEVKTATAERGVVTGYFRVAQNLRCAAIEILETWKTERPNNGILLSHQVPNDPCTCTECSAKG